MSGMLDHVAGHLCKVAQGAQSAASQHRGALQSEHHDCCDSRLPLADVRINPCRWSPSVEHFVNAVVCQCSRLQRCKEQSPLLLPQLTRHSAACCPHQPTACRSNEDRLCKEPQQLAHRAGLEQTSCHQASPPRSKLCHDIVVAGFVVLIKMGHDVTPNVCRRCKV
jgi:hypothetical protein